ncbi:olfactomedin-like protein 2B [Anabas testudineus]|uniref:Olfactomedin-like domain-containing protein n=1 Tax=Anabas testudineus TaxID=64144 RepID=A0A3Q1IJY6_ANATE|nr:olfactomedin-like protein 2B [Anabas testudineus]
MWRQPSLLLLLCWALPGPDALQADRSAEPSRRMLPSGAAELGKADNDGPSAAEGVEASRQRGARQPPDTSAAPAEQPLEDEMDNQENIISQLLGDYDKVKTVSSGSDCVCQCVVRPIKRSDCSHIQNNNPTSSSNDFYTVETVTKGTDCKKCVCMAPSSAVNPCEGEYRFKKLQEASKDDIKLATIIDLLEGSLYGMDLLKLHSVTTKLMTRMDNMEKAFARNLTERARAKEHVKEKAKEKEKEKKGQQKKKKVNDLERAGQKSGAPAYDSKQKNSEGQLKKDHQQDGLEQQQQPNRNKTGTQKPIKEKNSVVIRGVTFYKAEEESYKEDERGRRKNLSLAVDTSVDLLISDSPTTVFPIQNPGPAPTQRPTAPPAATHRITPTTNPADTNMKLTTILTPTTTKPTTTSHQATTIVQRTIPGTQGSTKAPDTRISTIAPMNASITAASRKEPKSRLSWTESPVDQPKTTKKPAVCKDTVASISEPVQHNSYGLSDGAWMRDARGHGKVIYLTNGHYGSNLLEFRDIDTFKSGQASNSYKLPYSFTGTGHVVFNGAFYYNRAFSRDIIRYDLRHRYVAAWTTLHDALLEEQAHRTQTEVEFAVDESGLWLLYPAMDTEGFHQEVILLTHIHPRDLQPVRSFRTGLRRGHYGNCFLVCGVLYAVDSMERRYANVTYAFDTHTLTHTVPSLAFTNMHAHTSQLAYCPLDKKLYAWDNGHQMMYDVIFAY